MRSGRRKLIAATWRNKEIVREDCRSLKRCRESQSHGSSPGTAQTTIGREQGPALHICGTSLGRACFGVVINVVEWLPWPAALIYPYRVIFSHWDAGRGG